MTRQQITEEVRSLVALIGVRGAARQLGMARNTIYGLLRGSKRTMPGTLALLERKLAPRPESAQP